MKIYVAGAVPRAGMEPSVVSHLEGIYLEIEITASETGHTVQLPRFEEALKQMEARVFQEEIHRRIMDADSVITVLDPPSLSVAFEAHFAAGTGKPQAILVKDLVNPPPGVRELTQVDCYRLWETPMRNIVQQLAAQVAKKAAVAPQAEAQQASVYR